MARTLARIGRWAARKAGFVLAGWATLLAAAVVGFLVFGGALATSFSIPGTETERVSNELEAELGSTATTGTVVFATSDGDTFTESQQNEVERALDQVASLDGVTETIHPFEAEDQRAEQVAELEDGAAQIEQGRTDLEEGREQIDDGLTQVDEGLEQLEQAEEQLAAGLEQAQQFGSPQAAELEAQLEQVRQQQEELTAQREELVSEREGLPEAEAELDRNEELIEQGRELLALADGVRTVSPEGDVALGIVVFTGDVMSVSEDLKAEVMEVIDGAAIAGVDVEYSAEIADSVSGLVGPAEVVGIAVAALVLLVMFRAVRPAALPIASSFVGVGVGVAGSLALSDVVEMTSVTPILGLMLGLAVGIDYSLFIINRHRRQVREGMDVAESIPLANGTAGSAVVFAGVTVMIALLALNLTGVGFLGLMGTVGAVCVLSAVLVATTLTPALLSLLGRKVLSRRERKDGPIRADGEGTASPMPTVRAVLTVVATIVALLVIALPALQMRLGLPDGSAAAQDSTQYRAYAVTEQAFGAGQNGPLVVTASLPDAVPEDEELSTQLEIARVLSDQPDVAAVAPVGFSDAGDFLAFQVIGVDGPSSESTEALVHDLRELTPLADGTELGVAGLAAGNIDISDQLAQALPVYLAVVVGLSLIILMIVFRSVLVPLLATGGFVLSLFAALGATTAVFQWGWLGGIFDVHDPGPLLNFLPLLLAGVLFGLAMDYQIFVASGMREAFVHGMPARSAVISGLRHGRVVVTAAAIIMIAVFGSFSFAHLTMVRPIGFALAVGVLFDAFVVRMLLLPAVMHLLGRAAWWMPRWLDRIVPNVDIEGTALERSTASAPAGASADR